MLIGDVIPLCKIDEAWGGVWGGGGGWHNVNVCVRRERAWRAKLQSSELSPGEFDLI